MAQVFKYQNFFTSGELSPLLYSRSDYEKYPGGCELAENAVILPHGGATKRPGLELCDTIAPVEEDSNDGLSLENVALSVLIPFVYNVDQTCVILFRPSGFNIISNGKLVMDGDAPLLIKHPYRDTEIREVRFCQSADILFLAHPNHPPMKLMRLDVTLRNWRLEELVVKPGINPPATITATAEGFNAEQVTRNVYYAVTAVSANGEESLPVEMPEDKPVVVPASWTAGAKIAITWDKVDGAKSYEVFKNANGSWGWIGKATTNKFTDINIEGDAGFGFKEFRSPFDTSEISGGALKAPSNVKAILNGGISSLYTWKNFYRIAAVNANGAIGNASETCFVRFKYDNANENEPRKGFGKNESATITWDAVSDAVSYNVYLYSAQWDDSASNYDYVLLANVTATEYTDTGVIPSGDNLTLHPNTAYPGVVSIFQQRLIFGRSNLMPQTIWTSEAGNFASFSVHAPLIDSDAMTLTMDSTKVNEIRHFVPLRQLLVLTSYGEYVVGGESQGAAIKPSSVNNSIQSYWGSSVVPPITVGVNVLFLQNNGKQVRNMQYKFTEDGFVGADMSLIAEHLFDSPVVDWCLQEYPHGLVWACKEDGSLISLTWMPEQEVVAWARHTSGCNAKFFSCSCVREAGEDRVYFLVRRIFKRNNGEGTFFRWSIERLSSFADSKDLDKCCYLDFAMRSKTLNAYLSSYGADGNNLFAYVDKQAFPVKDGVIMGKENVDTSDGVVNSMAGIGYAMTLRTVNPEITSNSGFLMGNHRCVVRVYADIQDSRYVLIGSDAEHLEVLDYPPTAEQTLHSGIYEVIPGGNFGTSASITVRSEAPYPCTIRSVSSIVEVGEY